MATKRKGARGGAKSKYAKSLRSNKPRTARQAMAIATSTRHTVKQRVAAIGEVPLAVCDSDDNLQAMLKVLRDGNEKIEVRLAALQSLQAASFSVLSFESCRGDYIAALRAVAGDPDFELRQRVLGILMREKDGFAEKWLLEGLENPAKALVPPEKALQLLSYNVHVGAYAVARKIADNPPNAVARREALRLLASDATAAPVFEKIMRDKSELTEIRQLSASALQAMKPQRLQSAARDILLDKSDYDEIKATSLTALTQFADEKSMAADNELRKHVGALSQDASAKVKKSAKRFINKYGG